MKLYCVICNTLLEPPKKKVCGSIICKRKQQAKFRQEWKKRNPEKMKKINEDRRKKIWLKKGFSEPPPKKEYQKKEDQQSFTVKDDLEILNKCRINAGLKPLTEMPTNLH